MFFLRFVLFLLKRYAEGIKKKPDPNRPKPVQKKSVEEVEPLAPPSGSNVHAGSLEEIRQRLDARPLRDSRSPQTRRSRSRSPRGRGAAGSGDAEVPGRFLCMLTGEPATDPVRGASGDAVYQRAELVKHVKSKRKDPETGRPMFLGQITTDRDTLREFRAWCERNLHARGSQRLLDELNRSAAEHSDSDTGMPAAASINLDQRREDRSRPEDRYYDGGRDRDSRFDSYRDRDRQYDRYDDRDRYPSRRHEPSYNDGPPDSRDPRYDSSRDSGYRYQSPPGEYIPPRYDTRDDEYGRRDYDPRDRDYPPRDMGQRHDPPEYAQRVDSYPPSGEVMEPRRDREFARQVLTGQPPSSQPGPSDYGRGAGYGSNTYGPY